MPASETTIPENRDGSKAAAHTPAPWNFVLNHEGKPWLLNSGYAIVAYGVPGSEDGGQICEVSVQSKPKRGDGWRHDCPVRDANARLIASAPDLLKACRAAEVFMANQGFGKDLLAQLRSAIQRAEGGQ